VSATHPALSAEIFRCQVRLGWGRKVDPIGDNELEILQGAEKR